MQDTSFTDPKEGLVAAIDKKFRELQQESCSTQSYDMLTLQNLLKLYLPPSLSKRTTMGSLKRMVFNIALMTSLRRTSLVTLRMSQFSRHTVDGDMARVIICIMDSQDVASKAEKAGLESISENSTSVCVWREERFGSELCVFHDIDENVSIGESRNMGSDGFYKHSKKHRIDNNF